MDLINYPTIYYKMQKTTKLCNDFNKIRTSSLKNLCLNFISSQNMERELSNELSNNVKIDSQKYNKLKYNFSILYLKKMKEITHLAEL